MREGVCDAGREYCLLEDHVKFGPAAAGVGGRTPLVAYLDCSFFAGETEKYPWIWEQVCSNRSDWGPWTTTRGRVRGFCSSLVGGRGGGGRREEQTREKAKRDEEIFFSLFFFTQLLTPLVSFLQISLPLK